MAAVDADVWALTETVVDYAPAEGYEAVYSAPHPDRRPVDERWAAVWSRWPITPIDDPAPHRRGAVAALIEVPDGPVIVYATVIAWANESHFDDGSPAKMWQVHMAEIERQGAEWRRIRERFPDVPLVVAGDFNQDRGGSGWYGTKAGRELLTDELASADLELHTDGDVVADGLLDVHLIDHIAATPDLRLTSMRCWPSDDADGVRLSDHPTVAVDLERS